jgi:hypothetical protein
MDELNRIKRYSALIFAILITIGRRFEVYKETGLGQFFGDLLVKRIKGPTHLHCIEPIIIRFENFQFANN